MRFLKLLDPFAVTQAATQNDPSAVAKQQEVAAIRFPELVAESNLHYWRPGDEIPPLGRRVLIGLAASYDLRDLRLADLVNDELNHNLSLRVEVFNVQHDCADFSDLAKYYPNHPGTYFTPPIVGVWQDGVFEFTETGFDARRLILKLVGSSTSAEESVSGLSPPNPKMMEG